MRALCLSTGKHPVSCGDRAGFIVNALLFPYLNDAVKLHEAGGGTLDEIDDAMKATKLPMGPFQLLDVVGNDVSLAIQKTLVGDVRPRRLAAGADAGEARRRGQARSQDRRGLPHVLSPDASAACDGRGALT